jgi:hypothetical protein
MLPQDIFYPKVFYPRDLEEIFEEIPSLAEPNLLSVPTPPELPSKPSPPEEFSEPPPKALNYKLLGSLSFVLVVVGGVAFAQTTLGGLMVLGGLALLLGGAALYRTNIYPKRLARYRQRRQLHEEKVEQYRQLLGEWESKKQKILEQHQQDKEEYERRNQLIEREHQEKIDAWQLEQFRERAKQLTPSPLGEPVNTKNFDSRSYAETNGRFPHLLRQYFGDKIQILYHISGTNNRVPDFAYIDNNYPLNIDIEIDEPYTPRQYHPNSKKRLKILHNIDNSYDKNRLNEVLKNDWFVIYFSERQVLKEPQACCKAIALLIDRITGSNLVEQYFQEVPDLTPDLCWTKEEAREMANRQERLNY